MFYLDDERVGRVVLKYVNGSFNQEQRDLFHDDHLQTPMALERWPTSGSAGIVWSASYEPWGQANVNGGSSAVVDLRFPGQWYDAETESRVWQSGVNTLLRPGIAQNWMREYDAAVGAYDVVDPIIGRGMRVGPHGGQMMVPFGYASADPVAGSDPAGLWPYPPGQLVVERGRSFVRLPVRPARPPQPRGPQPPPPALPAPYCVFSSVGPARVWDDQGLCPHPDYHCWVFDCGGELRGWLVANDQLPPMVVEEEGPPAHMNECDPVSGEILFQG